MRNLEDAIEAQHALDALLRPRFRADPVIAHAHEDEPSQLREPRHVGALDAGVLHMRGNDAETLPVERDQLERLAKRLHRLQLARRAMSAPQAPSFSSSRSKPRSR